jgi:hypothetical protein
MHLRQHGGDTVENASDVDVDHAVPVLDLEIAHRRKRHDAGIVDQHIDFAELGFCEGDEVGGVLAVRDVDGLEAG